MVSYTYLIRMQFFGFSVVTRQNGLRKRLNERIKSVAAVDVASRDTWRHLVAQLSHTRAVWYSSLREPPCVWQLNPTEGPQRERRRLERARRRIDQKFFRSQERASAFFVLFMV